MWVICNSNSTYQNIEKGVSNTYRSSPHLLLESSITQREIFEVTVMSEKSDNKFELNKMLKW